jgi:hypothetical protein
VRIPAWIVACRSFSTPFSQTQMAAGAIKHRSLAAS